MKKLPTVFDVAVVGAGPAGSVAATVLARAGLDVVLVANDANPRRLRNIGETIGPTALPVLARLRLTSASGLLSMSRVSGFNSCWGSSRPTFRPSIASADAETFSVDRMVFDGGLRDAAKKAGASIRNGHVSLLERLELGWRLQLRDGSMLRAKFIIDSSGRGSHFLTHLGIRLLGIDKLTAVTRRYEAAENDVDQNVMTESCQDGWLYSALTVSGARIVSFFTDRDLLSDARSSGLKWGFQLQDSHLIGNVISADRAFEQTLQTAATLTLGSSWRDGIIAAGDASRTRDPLSSQGVTAAMVDGEAVALAVIRSIQCNNDHSPLEEHERTRRNAIKSYLAERHAHYRMEQRWRERLFWKRRSIAGETVAGVEILQPRLASFQ